MLTKIKDAFVNNNKKGHIRVGDCHVSTPLDKSCYKSKNSSCQCSDRGVCVKYSTDIGTEYFCDLTQGFRAPDLYECQSDADCPGNLYCDGDGEDGICYSYDCNCDANSAKCNECC